MPSLVESLNERLARAPPIQAPLGEKENDMRTSMTAVTALAGSLLLAPLMMGPSQAGSAPDLKNALSSINDASFTLVRSGGGGGHSGGGGNAGGGGHMNAVGSAGGRVGVQASASHRSVAQASTGPRSTSHNQSVSHWNGNRSHNRHFANGGYYGGYPYDYGDDCYWLRRYSWARYQACIGVY